jgi:hypothetical protein
MSSFSKAPGEAVEPAYLRNNIDLILNNNLCKKIISSIMSYIIGRNYTTPGTGYNRQINI